MWAACSAAPLAALGEPGQGNWYAGHWDRWRSSGSVEVWEDKLTKTYTDGEGSAFLVHNWSVTHDHRVQLAIACSPDCQYDPVDGCGGSCTGGCHNDPGCRSYEHQTICDPEDPANCWTDWSETCPNGDDWFCSTVNYVLCCEKR